MGWVPGRGGGLQISLGSLRSLRGMHKVVHRQRAVGGEAMGSEVKQELARGQPGAKEGGSGGRWAAELCSWEQHIPLPLGAFPEPPPPPRPGLQLPASLEQTHTDTYKHPDTNTRK